MQTHIYLKVQRSEDLVSGVQVSGVRKTNHYILNSYETS